MKIAVLNGSPKGDISVTMQYVAFLQQEFPEHQFRVLNIAQDIKKIEQDEDTFHEILRAVHASDGVLWAFPLYFCLVHSNYKRFIELISEGEPRQAFQGKYAAALTTSIHFFDHTAHNYIQAVSEDLIMQYFGGYSADMDDLLKEEERARLITFAKSFFTSIKKKSKCPKSFLDIIWGDINSADYKYVPGRITKKVDLKGKKIIVLTDAEENDTNLVSMIARFCKCFSTEVEGINLNSLKIAGGCLGCIKCGYDNHCVYEGKDDYIEFFNSKVKTADILVFAGSIHDRYLSSRWKLFFDRSFFNTHKPVLDGKQVAFIISGPLGQIPNIREIMDGYVELQMANLAGYVTDEYGNKATDSMLDMMAQRLVDFSESGYIKTPSFLGVGGQKLFRDHVWGRLRPTFHADHLCFKRLGVYDFPQYDWKTRAQTAFYEFLLRFPSVRKEYAKRTKVEMIKPLQKVLLKGEHRTSNTER